MDDAQMRLTPIERSTAIGGQDQHPITDGQYGWWAVARAHWVESARWMVIALIGGCWLSAWECWISEDEIIGRDMIGRRLTDEHSCQKVERESQGA